jgi:hypothetical protein
MESFEQRKLIRLFRSEFVFAKTVSVSCFIFYLLLMWRQFALDGNSIFKTKWLMAAPHAGFRPIFGTREAGFCVLY